MNYDREDFEYIVDQKIKEANRRYGLSISIESVKWYKRGLCAGYAGYDKDTGVYSIELSAEAAILYPMEMATEVIAHEVAHLVQYARGYMHIRHKRLWKNTCIDLGGSGKTRFAFALTKARKVKQYQYLPLVGDYVWVGSRSHHKMQKLHKTRRVKATGERILAEQFTGHVRTR